MDFSDIAIIDYGMGNLFSVQQACQFVGAKAKITSLKEDIADADAVILPGVGAFGDAIANLKNLDLIEPLMDFIQSDRPFMGVCLGMQLLFSESEEFGPCRGLNVIPGRVVKFDSGAGKKIKVPHVGWNRIEKYVSEKGELWSKSPLCNLTNGEFVYFAHSYYCIPEDSNVVASVTNYETIMYCSSILYKNIFACQFHPERSGRAALEIYKNFTERTIKDSGNG